MKALLLVLLALAPAYAKASFSQYQVGACAQDAMTTADIAEDREDADLVELQLLDANGAHTGSLFASWTTEGELYGHHLRLCGKGDNYFYVNAGDLRNWAGKDVADLKTVSVMETNSTLDTDSIHHDEAVSLVAVETLAIDKNAAQVRVIFQAWNFASEHTTSGVFTTTIPLKK